MREPDLKVTSESAGMRLLKLTAEVSEEFVEQEMRRIASKINLPGFRKGKAPYDVVLQRYGEDTIRAEAAEKLSQEVYRETLEREGVVPYAPGTLVETELVPLRYIFSIPLPPVVELGKYRSLRIKPAKVRVTKKDVAQALERLRQEHAVQEPVEGREARFGDVLVVNVEGRAEDDTLFVADEEAEVLLDPENDYPAPGFHQALEGMATGEERTFRLKMPEGRPSEEAEFTVRLVRLFERILPGLDDDLARVVGNFEDLKALQNDVKEVLLHQKRREADEEYTQKVIETVVERARVEYPPVAVDEVVDDLVEQFERRVERERRMSLPDYLKVVGKEEDELREELRPRAEERLRRSLVFSRVVGEENLEVTDEEVEERIARLSEAWGDRADGAREQLQTGENRELITNDLLVDKVIDRLVAIARGEAESKEG